MKVFSLLDVTTSIQKTLAERYTTAFWVKAEMNRLNLHPPSGHCYPELVEKKDGRIIAEIGSNLWKDDYRRINDNFLQVLKEPLKNGITILFQAKIVYDPVYGLRLRILDIDPAYALGELERERLATIERLKNEGIFEANRRLSMPLLTKRIAVISVETSKGYSDFVQTIEGNPWGYRFFLMLFPAILQGERSASSIIAQLRRIRSVLHHFDAVAIIRGGGGEVGLTCYNEYALCREIALFPMPVITGIGHSTNETVSELVAFRNAITPTDLADYLLRQFHDFALPVQRAGEILADRSLRMIADQQQQLMHSVRYFRSVTGHLLLKNEHGCLQATQQLKLHSAAILRRKREDTNRAAANLQDRVPRWLQTTQRELIHIEKTVNLLDPKNVLQRGYSITYHGDRLLTDPSAVQPGDEIRTILAGGELPSIAAANAKTKPS